MSVNALRTTTLITLLEDVFLLEVVQNLKVPELLVKSIELHRHLAKHLQKDIQSILVNMESLDILKEMVDLVDIQEGSMEEEVHQADLGIQELMEGLDIQEGMDILVGMGIQELMGIQDQMDILEVTQVDQLTDLDKPIIQVGMEDTQVAQLIDLDRPIFQITVEDTQVDKQIDQVSLEKPKILVVKDTQVVLRIDLVETSIQEAIHILGSQKDQATMVGQALIQH